MKKECTLCHKEKEAAAFRKKVSRADGLSSACKVCLKVYDTKRNETLKQRDNGLTPKGHNWLSVPII